MRSHMNETLTDEIKSVIDAEGKERWNDGFICGAGLGVIAWTVWHIYESLSGALGAVSF